MSQKRPNRVHGGRHDEFWARCAEGELHVQRCGSCGELAWPVVGACELCGSQDLAFERMSGKGRLISWCTFERDYYRGLLPIPWPTILVALDEGPLFVSNPQGFGEEDYALDMPLRVTFLDCEDDAGAFRLPVFERDA